MSTTPTITPYGPVNHLGLVDYDVNQVDPNTQSEIDALPVVESNNPQVADEVQMREYLSRESVKRHRWENQAQFERVRPGRILSNGEFLFLIRKIVPSMSYNNWTTGDGLVGMYCISRGEIKYICAAQLGMMHEYDTVHTDERGLVTRHKFRGWRTLLLACIKAGAITEEQANRVFGKAEGPEAGPFLKQLWHLRNTVVQ